jgi:hypothetical protein
MSPRPRRGLPDRRRRSGEFFLLYHDGPAEPALVSAGGLLELDAHPFLLKLKLDQPVLVHQVDHFLDLF